MVTVQILTLAVERIYLREMVPLVSLKSLSAIQNLHLLRRPTSLFHTSHYTNQHFLVRIASKDRYVRKSNPFINKP